MLSEDKMLSEKVWAVVGANCNPEKYGNMIYRKLRRKGYRVYAVNPKYKTIDGDPCYDSLSALPEKPAVVNLVVSPAIGRQFIEQAISLKIPYIWFQPGTYTDDLGRLAEQAGLEIAQACALVATR